MVVNIEMTVAGTKFEDWQNLRLHRSLDKYNQVSNFFVTLDSPFGRHKTDFSVGQEVIIKADQDASPTTKIFAGILEKVRFKGKGNTETVELSGRDFGARLLDDTVEPIVFTDSEVSTIVTNIMGSVSDVTVNNVNVTTTTLKRIAFNHLDVFKALQELGKLSGFYFFVDENKDLNFKQVENVSSGVQLDNTNVTRMNHDRTREGMANDIWVYGDRTLAGEQEVQNADGGSIFTLLNKPHNTVVRSSSFPGSIFKGGISDLTVVPTSGTEYLVDFHDREIVFQSGTEIGYNRIPTSGGSIIVDYQKEIPIVKRGQNRGSITSFGKKRKVIDDKSIKDPATAEAILKKELENADPFRRIECDLKGWFTFNPGETVRVILDDFNEDGQKEIPILDITYTFDINTTQSEKIVKVRLDKKVLDLTDEITNLRKRLSLIEAKDRQNTDVITRLEEGTGSLIIVGSTWAVKTRTLGSSFVLDVTPTTTGPTFGARLGSIVASGINFLGDSRGPLTAFASGGFGYPL